MGKRSYRPLPPQVREAFERGDGKALARMRAKGLKTLEERQAKKRAEQNLLAIDKARVQDRRAFDEFLRRKQAHEDLVPIDPDTEVVMETYVEEPSLPAAPLVPGDVDERVQPIPATTDEDLHKLYDAFPRPRPKPPRATLKELLAQQIEANELYFNPHTGQVEPLSPPPGADE